MGLPSVKGKMTSVRVVRVLAESGRLRWMRVRASVLQIVRELARSDRGYLLVQEEHHGRLLEPLGIDNLVEELDGLVHTVHTLIFKQHLHWRQAHNVVERSATPSHTRKDGWPVLGRCTSGA